MNSDIENKEELLALTTCSVCGSDSATSNQIDINKHMRELESELATLKATVFNVQDVAKAKDILKMIVLEMPKTLGEPNFELLYKDIREAFDHLNQLPQATDNKDGEEND